MNKSTMLLGFTESKNQCEKLATYLNVSHKIIDLHHFPDKESLITLPTELTENVILFRSLHEPNNKLIECFLIAKTLKQKNVKRLTLVAPYLCYMRQDIENNPGEVVSQKIIGGWLAELFDDVITVDTHLHRINHLQEAIPLKNAINLLASDPMVRFLQTEFKDAMIFGPDSESEQWVSEIAGRLGFEYAVANKVRKGDHKVHITLPEENFKNRNIVIVDDIASTGRTAGHAAELLKEANAASINLLVTHALFFSDAKAYLGQSGINNIWSTDSIPDSSNIIELHPLIGNTIQHIFEND